MRGSSLVAAILALSACSSRTADYPEDFTEEVARICDSVCGKEVECVDPPYMEYEECLAICNGPGAMLEDNACGEAFRAMYGCVADTQTCEEYLDTKNSYAEDYLCKAETLATIPLECGAPDGSE